MEVNPVYNHIDELKERTAAIRGILTTLTSVTVW